MAPNQARMFEGRAKTLRDCDADTKKWVESFKPQVESQLNKKFKTFDAQNYNIEMFAGSSYKVKVCVGENQFIQLNLFKPLPNSNEVDKITSVEDGKTLEDPLC